MKTFPFYQQLDAMDCGPTCLRMVAKHYGKHYTLQKLRDRAEIGKEGVSLLGISQTAEGLGFKSLAVKISYAQLVRQVPLPCIVHWNQNHFVVVYGTQSKASFGARLLGKAPVISVLVADPARGYISYTQPELESRWASTASHADPTGIALLLEPTQAFYTATADPLQEAGVLLLFGYLRKYKSLVFQLALGLLAGSMLALVLPFLTQSVVDVGIQTRNIKFIYLVVIAQLMLFVGRTTIDFIRSWILLHINTRINLSILSDFLIKLLKLPVSFFDSKQTGDILQRIGDHQRIEQFLTGSSLNVVFSVFNLLIFGFMLASYHLPIFYVFMGFSVLYVCWILVFLRFRRSLDIKRFALAAQNQGSLIQLISAVPELKLNDSEIKQRWAWENLQIKNFMLNIKGLAMQQYQQAGGIFLNEGKNIVISFLAATAVVNGQMTLGVMMALQYIIGQLNSPIEQLIHFIQQWQDAAISLERLNEIHEIADEEPTDQPLLCTLPEHRGILFNNVTFTYAGAGNLPVLKNISLMVPQGKITAIVGASGSGKTTLIKLLLKFYYPQSGEIRIGHSKLNAISHRFWRSKCGTVMQDGFILSESIANNIAISSSYLPDTTKLLNATKVANIQEFIDELPLGYNTKIGADGNGISQGQRQRLLIARAVYKNHDYLFFDEATNALDTTNERIIMENLANFFEGKTVIVVAHRLSTVKNADQIVVLEKGEVAEIGTHENLVALRGKYYELVRNQLELGN